MDMYGLRVADDRENPALKSYLKSNLLISRAPCSYHQYESSEASVYLTVIQFGVHPINLHLHSNVLP